MAEPDEILAAAVRAVRDPQERMRGSGDLAGRRILVTAGPTHEPIDAVRYLGNRSSGTMGFAVAAEATRRGARVTLVSGPVALEDPPDVEVVRIETADEMAAAVIDRYAEVDAVVMAAAVADFRPERAAAGKLKKESGPPSLVLQPTTDILATLGKRKEHQVLVGFAAETDQVEEEGRRKLGEKNLDLMVANEVGRPGTGFGAGTNRAALLSRSGDDVSIRSWTKAALAASILDRVTVLLEGSREPQT
jgi:phosphopantothenoylcysteine decarboxylase/phosphopantothenate--cysteine ligase